MAKRAHITALGAMPRIAAAWRDAQGSESDEADSTRSTRSSSRRTSRRGPLRATLIPGAADTIAALRERGLKIGSTTGYTRDIMEELLPVAARQGYAPGQPGLHRRPPRAADAADDVQCFLDLAVWPASAASRSTTPRSASPRA